MLGLSQNSSSFGKASADSNFMRLKATVFALVLE
jgi:hypothetical protein